LKGSFLTKKFYYLVCKDENGGIYNIIKAKGIRNASEILSFNDFIKVFKGENITIGQTRFSRDLKSLNVDISDTQILIKGLKNKDINDLFNKGRNLIIYKSQDLSIIKYREPNQNTTNTIDEYEYISFLGENSLEELNYLYKFKANNINNQGSDNLSDIICLLGPVWLDIIPDTCRKIINNNPAIASYVFNNLLDSEKRYRLINLHDKNLLNICEVFKIYYFVNKIIYFKKYLKSLIIKDKLIITGIMVIPSSISLIIHILLLFILYKYGIELHDIAFAMIIANLFISLTSILSSLFYIIYQFFLKTQLKKFFILFRNFINWFCNLGSFSIWAASPFNIRLDLNDFKLELDQLSWPEFNKNEGDELNLIINQKQDVEELNQIITHNELIMNFKKNYEQPYFSDFLYLEQKKKLKASI
jgi:hypothetical protein